MVRTANATGRKNKKSKEVKSSKVAENKSTVKEVEVKTEAAVNETVVNETVVNEQVNVESVEQPEEDESLSSSINQMLDSLLASSRKLNESQKEISVSLKNFMKDYKKETKELEKSYSKNKNKSKKNPNRVKRTPSGFAVPSKISDEMCEFLGIAKDTHLSRTDVTRKLTNYIRVKDLQVESNRRRFTPDAPLSAILGPLQDVDKEKGYTYFNLQRYITPHIKSSSSKEG
tara:strand:- start:1900 stop:2589 length:690 start_codon:yes stop_codon:yes gene_type:complete